MYGGRGIAVLIVGNVFTKGRRHDQLVFGSIKVLDARWRETGGQDGDTQGHGLTKERGEQILKTIRDRTSAQRYRMSPPGIATYERPFCPHIPTGARRA